jgi:hypothetical protein
MSDTVHIAVARRDGVGERSASIEGRPECAEHATCPFGVQSVSDDGRFVAAGDGNTDPGRARSAHYVMDMVTGKAVPLPSVRGSVNEIFFRPDGGMVLRATESNGHSTLYVVGSNHAVTITVPEPDALRGLDIVAYRP